MSMPTPQEFIELGQVFIQWGMMIVSLGLATIAFGFILLLIGKVFFKEQTELALAFIADQLNK